MSIPIYKTFLEKEEHFHVTRIDSIEAYKDLLLKHNESKGIYRGLGSGSYKIFTSLQRELFNRNIDHFNINKYVENARNNPILKEYFKTFGIVATKLSVLSYMQHYGAPTPFVDFTSNFRIATYFAISTAKDSSEPGDSPSNYCSLFFINNSNLDLIDITKVLEGWQEYKLLVDSSFGSASMNTLLNHYDDMFDAKTLEVYLVNHNPKFNDTYNCLNNIRILAQEGLFICNFFNKEPLEVALKKFFIDSTHWIGSEIDDIGDPYHEEINREYAENLIINSANQKRLEKNIIETFEINKKLIPEIKELLDLTDDKIYPDTEGIVNSIFEKSV